MREEEAGCSQCVVGALVNRKERENGEKWKFRFEWMTDDRGISGSLCKM
jgi:hypothetical protein